MIPNYYEATYVVPTYNSPCSIVERAAFVFSPVWHAIAINNQNNLLSIFLMAIAAILDSQHRGCAMEAVLHLYILYDIVCVVQYTGFCIVCHLHCTCGNDVEGVNGNHSTVTPALQLSLLIMVVIPAQVLTS
jgi:hypothetical protein